MGRIKHKKVFIVLIVLSILKLILSAFLPNIMFSILTYDDKLMLDLSSSLSNFNWLGEYNSVTLIKGMFYPFILSLCNILKVKYTFFLSFMYILSCIYLCIMLNKIIKNEKIIYIIYILLLLNPLSSSISLFQRLYRNSLSLSQTLILVGSLIGFIMSKDEKDYISYGIIIGLITSTIILNREDYYWIYILLLGFLAIKVIHDKKSIKNIICFSIITILFTLIPINIVCYKNYKNYGVYTTNVLGSGNFKKMVLNIMSIDTHENTSAIITRKMYEVALENSKSLNILMDNEFEEKFEFFSQGKEIDNSVYIWVLRKMTFNSKYTAKELNHLYDNVSDELKRAFDDGLMDSKCVGSSIFIVCPNKKIIFNSIRNTFNTLLYISTYKDVYTASKNDLINSKKISISYSRYTSDNIVDLYIDDYNKTEDIIKVNYKDINSGIFNILAVLYRIINPILCLMSFVSVIYIHIKQKKIKDKILININFILLLASMAIVYGVAYTHTTLFESIRYYYLGSAYMLFMVFNVINIYIIYSDILVGKYEKN